MQLSANEEGLADALVWRLAALTPNTAIDRSDSWTDSDLQELNAGSVLLVENAEKEDSG